MNSLSKRLPRRVAQNVMMRLQSSTTSTSTSQEIQIPNRIERGSTDILQALASTIKRDPTAAHYKYHDDPYFIPMSNTGKRSFALSQEAGRKAAMWVREKHPDLFQHKVADPVIPSFLPRAVYKEKSEVSEEVLLNAIGESRLEDALTIYELLGEQDVGIAAKQSLLELICFCNDEEPLAEDLVEERWYRQTSKRQRNTWKNNPLAEKLFAFLKGQGGETEAAAYSALLCGTAKFTQVDRAWQLYGECGEKGIPLNVRAYNSLLSIVPFLKEGVEERLSLMKELLVNMAQEQLRPNTSTLNACLQVASTLRGPNPSRQTALSILKEMRNMGVEPSLASYYYLLITFCNDKGPTSGILSDILDQLEGKEFTIQDPKDTFFFVTAMSVARNNLSDRILGHRVHTLLLIGNNYNLIGDSYKESIYYRHYMSLMVATEPLEDFMKLYNALVPNIYIPEPSVMDEILQAVEVAGPQMGGELLPQLWSQMVTFDHADRQNLLIRILQAMQNSCAPPPDSPLHETYAEIAWNVWNHIQGQSAMRSQRIAWTGGMLGDVAVLSLRGGQFERALDVLALLEKDQGTIFGTPTVQQLNEIFESCITKGHVLGAIAVVQFAADAGFAEAGIMGRRVASTMALNAPQEARLTNIVGKEVLQQNVDSS